MSVGKVPDELWIIETAKAVGDRIRIRRLHLGVTQDRLAELTGLDRRTVQRIEYGATDAKLSHLLRIAKALRMHPRDLLG